MDPATITTAILSFLQVIQALIPTLSATGNTIALVSTVITALDKIIPVITNLAPLVSDEVTLIYQGVKNIIANLRGTDTTAEQDAALDALDARVDAAWDSIAPKFDPDYVPPAPITPTTS